MIGGWSSALNLQKGLHYEVVAAYDVNSISNEVYEHNYCKKPSSSAIESLSLKTLDALRGDIWVLSPPCQPHTRQHETNTTTEDPRSKALTHIIQSIKRTKHPPTYIALENVIGFEKSSSCQMLLDTLKSAGYSFQQFALSPVQFGIPNERPRYYLLAVLNGTFINDDTTNSSSSNINTKVPCIHKITPQYSLDLLTSIPGVLPTPPLPLSSYLSDSFTPADISELLVPDKSLEKNASWCMDVVTADEYSTSCFTKSYSKYFKGTGSVLLIPDPTTPTTTIAPLQDATAPHSISRIADTMVASTASTALSIHTTMNNVTAEDFRQPPSTRVFQMNWKDKLKGNTLRFFSPEELLRLFGFIDVMGGGVDDGNGRKMSRDADKKYIWNDCRHLINSNSSNIRNNSSSSSSSNNSSDNNDSKASNDKSYPERCQGQEQIDDATTLEVEVELELYAKPFFPPSISNRKCYELIGNSLNVIVVSHLLHYLFTRTRIREESFQK